MKFCGECGHAGSMRVPPDDNRERFICDNCWHIHYDNPRVIVGVLPTLGNQVLLCKRAIEPRKGYWTLPAGFLENGESCADGAIRETWEEALASVANEQLYCLFDLPYINQIYMFFRAEMTKNEYSSGPESLEVELFDEEQIPWKELAFPVVTSTLKHFFVDRKNGEFPVRNETMLFRPPRRS